MNKEELSKKNKVKIKFKLGDEFFYFDESDHTIKSLIVCRVEISANKVEYYSDIGKRINENEADIFLSALLCFEYIEKEMLEEKNKKIDEEYKEYLYRKKWIGRDYNNAINAIKEKAFLLLEEPLNNKVKGKSKKKSTKKSIKKQEKK